MGETREYSFKPAALRPAQVWTVRDGHLLRRGGAAAIELSAINKAVWNTFTYRGTRSQWLHLSGPQGVTKLECNMLGGADAAAYQALVIAVAQTLGRVNPNLKIRVGGGEAYRWSLFLIGLTGALFGAAILISGLVGWQGQDLLSGVAIGGVILLLTAPIALFSLPGQSALELPADQFVDRLVGE